MDDKLQIHYTQQQQQQQHPKQQSWRGSSSGGSGSATGGGSQGILAGGASNNGAGLSVSPLMKTYTQSRSFGSTSLSSSWNGHGNSNGNGNGSNGWTDRVVSEYLGSNEEEAVLDYVWNYFEAGFDVVFDGETHCVKKFVWYVIYISMLVFLGWGLYLLCLCSHTNFPGTYDFHRYRKCHFQISVKRGNNPFSKIIF
jgi:hypothetical protein